MTGFAVALILLCAIPFVDKEHPGLTTDPEQRQREIARVLDMIRSEDSVKAAWGAYHAGKYRLKQHIPALLELVDREHWRPSDASAIVKKAALDALIGLDAPVPAEMLMARLEEEYMPETLILLAKEKSCDDLLHLMDLLPKDEQEWWVTAGLLTSMRPPGLARRLLWGIRFELVLCVHSPGARPRLGTAVTGPGMARSRSRDGDYDPYPPWPRYWITNTPGEGAIVLQERPVPIYYRRHESSHRPQMDRTIDPMFRSYRAFECLKALLTEPIESFPLYRTVGIEWVDEEDYLEKAKTGLDDVRSAFRGLLERLKEEGLLAAAESVAPDIRVSVKDMRENTEIELPKLSF